MWTWKEKLAKNQYMKKPSLPSQSVKRLIPCARVSTKDQGDNGTSLETQIEACTAYIQRIGAIALPPIAEDVSGVTPLVDRSKGSQILRLLNSGAADGVVWYDIDRFFRDDLEARIQVRMWLRAGVQIYFVDSGPLKSESDILFLFKSWMAGNERDKITSRTSRGKYGAVRLRNRVMISSTAPYGYDYADGKLTINEMEAAIVRKIYRWYIKGLDEDEARDLTARASSHDFPYMLQKVRRVFTPNEPLCLTRISTALHIFGIPCRSDYKPRVNRVSHFAEWQFTTISTILSRTTYYGVWTFGKEGKRDAAGQYINEPVSTEVPAIITRELWEAARAQALQNKRFAKRNRTYDYLLSGNVRCQCGRTMYGTTKHKQESQVSSETYYMCSSRTLPATFTNRCKVGGYRVDKFDDIVWRILTTIFKNPSNFVNGVRNMQSNQDSANARLQGMIEKVDHRLGQLDMAEELLIDQLSNQVFSPLVIQNKMHDVKAERLKQETARKEYTDQLHAVISDAVLNTFETECAELSIGIDHATFEDKRRYLKILNAEVVLFTDEHGGKRLHMSVLINGRRITLDEQCHVVSV